MLEIRPNCELCDKDPTLSLLKFERLPPATSPGHRQSGCRRCRRDLARWQSEPRVDPKYALIAGNEFDCRRDSEIVEDLHAPLVR